MPSTVATETARCTNHAAVFIPGQGDYCTDHMGSGVVRFQDRTGERAVVRWHDGYGQRCCSHGSRYETL